LNRRLALLAWLLAPALAHAGQRPFLWAYDTTIVSAGNIELEQWLWIRASDRPLYWVWWSPVVGVTRHIEVAAPIQINETNGLTELASMDLDVRWRLFPQDDRSGFQGLLRTAFHRDTVLDRSRLDFTLSTSYGKPDRPRLVAELGGQLSAPSGPQPSVGTYDVGFAYPFADGELQLAAESFGSMKFDGTTTPAVYAGGTVAWTSGRFWVTLGALVGLTNPTQTWPRVLPRLMCAVSL